MSAKLDAAALLKGATPGQWEYEYNNADNSGGGQWYELRTADGNSLLWRRYNCSEAELAEAEANAILLASSKQLAAEHAELTAENAELRAMNQQLRESVAQQAEAIFNNAENARLAARVAELEKDAARLDYLQRHGEMRMVWTQGSEPEPYGDVTDWGISDYPWAIEDRGDIRSTIDYHMKHEWLDESGPQS